MMYKVGLLGATGYTGQLLLKILCKHPHIQSVYPASLSNKEKPIKDFDILEQKTLKKNTYFSIDDLIEYAKNKEINILFSALPHGVSARYISQFLPKNNSQEENNNTLTVIDLSSDFRCNNNDKVYETHYNEVHPAKHLLAQATYGLSEWYRKDIKKSSLIACPGCYATSILLAILPILRHCEIEGLISIVSSSGVSGAGATLKPHLLFCERSQSIFPYSPGTSHKHTKEIAYFIEALAHTHDIPFVFSPQIVPMSQGMLSIITIPLSSKQEGIRAAQALCAQYIDEKWIKILEKNNLPETKTIQHTNNVLIGYKIEDNCIILFSALDNLWKGAVGQAIQNFNIRNNLSEDCGL